MLNQTLLIGRIVEEPELRETGTGKKVTNVRIAVPRPYKNENGVYEADFVDCVMWNNKAERASEYHKTGDLVLITARIHTYIDKDHKKQVEIVAEDISFLSKSKKAIEQEILQDDFEPEIEME